VLVLGLPKNRNPCLNIEIHEIHSNATSEIHEINKLYEIHLPKHRNPQHLGLHEIHCVKWKSTLILCGARKLFGVIDLRFVARSKNSTLATDFTAHLTYFYCAYTCCFNSKCTFVCLSGGN